MSKVAIVGRFDYHRKFLFFISGLIGQNWAMIFAGAGYHACLFDVDATQLDKALKSTRQTLEEYETNGYLRGMGTAGDQADRISVTGSLQECLNGAFYVQECVNENLDLKKQVFSELDDLATDDMILASSSSCLCASMFADHLQHKQNILVVHPVNPPYFVPLVEIVPAPFTKIETVQKVKSLMVEIGQSPVTLQRESLGFALNRIQYACINECWNMYKTGLLSAEDIDKVCHDGLGLRYAFIGPLETMHLNANGIRDYCERYAQGAYNVQKETFAPVPVMYDVETAKRIEADLKSSLPLDKLPVRRRWRDSMLAGLAKFKLESKSKKDDNA